MTMLSYMIPMDETKPPIGSPVAKDRLELVLDAEPVSISKDNSINSFASTDTTATLSHSSMTPTSFSDNKAKTKVIVNGSKHQTLKRVSFGSSKGSMVETLIYESPLQEEPEPSPVVENDPVHQFPAEDREQPIDEREKVKVSFFQQSRPQEVDLPDDTIDFFYPQLMMAAPGVILDESNHVDYGRQESTESGWDNPFRPGGDLSREADEIVELIKDGKPITPTSGNGTLLYDQTDGSFTGPRREPITESPKKMSATQQNSANGNVKNDKSPSGAVEVQRGVVGQASEAGQVEHVLIKKKPKCKCCVIQ